MDEIGSKANPLKIRARATVEGGAYKVVPIDPIPNGVYVTLQVVSGPGSWTPWQPIDGAPDGYSYRAKRRP